MKKLLLGLFALSTVVFGNDSEDSSSYGKMNIMATVTQPLTISEDKAMEFGGITRNQTSDATGTFIVDGEAGAKFTISFPSNTEIIHTNGISKMNVALRQQHNDDNVFTLGQHGKAYITINGQVHASDNQTIGSYSGEFVASVKYD